MSIPVVIISEENSLIELLKSYADESENFSYLSAASDFSKAYDAVKELKQVLLIVDISGYQEQALNFVSKVSSDCPKCRVITLFDKPDTDIVIRALRVGASDFVSMPVIKSEFMNSLEKIYNDLSDNNPQKSKCQVITVYSNKGGVGKTSVAVNLSYELAKITKENVALIDLNFQLGDVATFLDLKPSFNISYMLKNLDKINGDFLLSTLEKYKDTSLYVLADPPYIKHTEKISSKDVTKLFDILKETFSYVVVDTSGGFEKNALTAIENSDLVLLGAIVNLPALRNCQRCIEYFEKLGIEKDKIQVVVNRFLENDEISSDDVKEVLGRELYWKIPNNYFTMMSAINKGVPVSDVNPDSNVALSYKNLALNISDSIYRRKIGKEESFVKQQ